MMIFVSIAGLAFLAGILVALGQIVKSLDRIERRLKDTL